jgi:signal transduction histidine kinase
MTDEDLRRGRILAVDDDVSTLCLLKSVLRQLGFHQIRIVSDPSEILNVVDEFDPDLIITDLSMPGVDGFELVQRVRAHLPRQTCLPILVLTGNLNGADKRRALQVGASDILFKPFEASELQMRVRNLLQTRLQQLEIERQNQDLEQKVTARTSELAAALAELKASQRQVVQQERFRAFGEMAGGVVHDFNNALMSIIGYSDILLEDDALLQDRDLVRQYVKTMNTAGRDASHVVSRLRDFYRPREESDIFAALQVNELLEEVVLLTRPKWHGTALESGRVIRVELELQRVPPIFGNGSELREVLTNLIFNAVDAIPDGGRIILRTESVDDSVKIEVADTGIGMSEEVRQRCLEPFFSTKGEQGTGLGLPMVYGIIRRHEGTLDIETAPGRGTTFRIILPCHHASPVEETEGRLVLNRTLRVLVVDDELHTRNVVTQYLQGDGHRVTTAANGGDALRSFMAEDFDLVITDRGMPGMCGLQLAGALRRMQPEQPVILLTGFSNDETETHPLVDFVLKKPLARADLRSAVQRSQQRSGKAAAATAQNARP